MLDSISKPPGKAGQAYVLESLGGEIIYIPCSRSATRLLVTGKETDNAFAIVGSGGAQSAPIGFHYHREAHDIFLCLKGNVNVWTGDQCRTLGAGDLASAPPGTIHQYQILGNYTEFVGLIVPGGWEEFFRFIGDPYDGALFPLEDNRNPFEVLIPRLVAATEKFDMIPVRDHPYVEPQPWVTGKDNILPGSLSPYYLRSGTGPRYLIGGLVCSPLVTIDESAGRFAIASIEGSSFHDGGLLSRSFKFANVHHAIQVADGLLKIELGDGQSSQLSGGDTVYLPKATSFRLHLGSRYVKAYLFGSGGGLVELLRRVGTPYDQTLPPEKVEGWSSEAVKQLENDLQFEFS